MGKLVIIDECLVPRRLAWLHYKGDDPIGFLRDFKVNLRFIFEVSTTRCRERKLLWDYVGDPIRFYDEWKVVKQLSRFTTMLVTIRFIGYVSKGKQDGNFTMEMYGEIQNEFSPSNWFNKYIWLIYNYLFYGKMRERYVIMCRNYIRNFMDWCKEHYNMKAVTTPEGRIEAFDEDLIEQEREAEKE
jgi:hypothetical protein